MGILLFNWCGYQFLYNYLQSRSDRQIEKRLDQNNYNEKDLVSLKFALNLPYMNDQSEYQRIDGEINIDGIQYKYVKRRVFHDSLFILCIPAKEKMKLLNAKNDYFKSTSGIQNQGTNKSKT